MKISRHLLRLFGHQQYIRLRVRERIIRFFHNPDTANSEEFVAPFFGFKYRGNFNTFLDWNVFYFGSYAGEELRLIKEVLEPMSDPIVFDVGANIGNHAIYLAQHSSQVLAFEPYEGVSKRLVEKIKDNNINNIEICHFGLGESNSMEDYFPPASSNTGTGSFLPESTDSINYNDTSSFTLEIKIGDDFVKERVLNRIDFIKMDVEGFEPFALRGLKNTLEIYRPVVFFEWTQNTRKLHNPESRNAHESETGDALFPQDYVFYQFIANTDVFKFFRRLSYKLELLDDRWEDGNILAVPKEYAERVNALNPKPVIAYRLKNMPKSNTLYPNIIYIGLGYFLYKMLGYAFKRLGKSGRRN